MIVFDASAVISAALRETSVPGQALLHAEATDIFALSDPVDAEIEEVLNRPRFATAISGARRSQILTALRNGAAWFSPSERVTDCRDAKDNKYLELALASGADAIISGDADLLVLHPWRGVRILRPANYLAEVGRAVAPDGQSAGGGTVFTRDVANEDDEQEKMLSEVADPALAVTLALAQHAHAARGAYSQNTERALRADVAVFTGWCVAVGLGSLPAKPGTVAAFVDAMGEVKAPATVRRYVSSVATFHDAARLPNPCQDDVVRLALKRLHRARGRAQAQAAPLTRDLVDRMLVAAGDGTRGLRNRALLAVAYDSLCRRSELVALHRADLEAAQHGEGTITIRRSKTDQEGIGQVRYLAPDTMRHVAAWLSDAGHADGALFRSVGKAGAVGGPLDPGDVARVFKAMAASAGISPELVAAISGHSSRVGAAQDQVRHGVELPAVMQAGGWTSPAMVARYSAKLEARRGGAAKLALLQNRT